MGASVCGSSAGNEKGDGVRAWTYIFAPVICGIAFAIGVHSIITSAIKTNREPADGMGDFLYGVFYLAMAALFWGSR